MYLLLQRRFIQKFEQNSLPNYAKKSTSVDVRCSTEKSFRLPTFLIAATQLIMEETRGKGRFLFIYWKPVNMFSYIPRYIFNYKWRYLTFSTWVVVYTSNWYILKNTNCASLFACKLQNPSFVSNKLIFPRSISNVTNNNWKWTLKTVSLQGIKKHNINPFQSSSSLSIRAFFCIWCVIYTFFSCPELLFLYFTQSDCGFYSFKFC